MNDRLRAGMPEVTRLTRAGRLQEATAAIQCMLGGQPLTPTATEPVYPAERNPIEGVFRVVDRTPSQSGEVRHARPASARRQPVPERTPDGVPEGQFITGSYINQAGARSYKLYIPSAYQEKPLPLVVMLHGCTQDPDDFAAGTRMNQLAEEQRCFVLYPAQAQGANTSKCWNWFKESDQRREQGEPSLIAGMTRRIISDYPIDPERVYVAGLSAGGAMAVIMGMTYPELYAATGVHSGLSYAAAHDLPSAFAAMRQGQTINARMRTGKIHGPNAGKRAVPTIVFHGDHDTTVHPCNGEAVIAQSRTIRAGADTESQTSQRTTVQRGQVPGGHAYTRSVYRDVGGQPVVEQWLVHGAGHAWSGGSSNGSFTDPKGPDATREMIRFFLAHPRISRH